MLNYLKPQHLKLLLLVLALSLTTSSNLPGQAAQAGPSAVTIAQPGSAGEPVAPRRPYRGVPKVQPPAAVLRARAQISKTTVQPEANPRAPLPLPVAEHAAASDGTYLYVIGGYDGYGYITATQRYNPVSDSWQQLPPRPTAVGGVQGCYLGGRLYLPGGYDGAAYNGTMRVYDIQASAWLTGATYPGNGFGFGSVVCDAQADRVYAVGGYNGTYDTDNTRIYDAAADQWLADGTPLPVLSEGSAAAFFPASRNLILASGFLSGTQASPLVYRYNPAVNSWSSFAPVISATVFGAVALDRGSRFYIAGGYNQSYTATAGVQLYDSATGGWQVYSDSLTTPLQYNAAAIIQGRLFVVGGYSSGCPRTICATNQELATLVGPHGELRGRTTSAGAGVSGAVVLAQGGGRSYAADSDASGYYTLTLPVATTFDLSASKAGYLMATAVLSAGLLPPNGSYSQNFALTNTLGTIVGTVKDVSDEPLAGAVVAASGPITASTTTDPQGRYSLERLPAGSYNLSVSQFAYLTSTRTVAVAAGQTTTSSFILAASPGYQVAGQVRVGGRTVANATVVVLDTPLTTTTNLSGSYSLRLPTGSYTLVAYQDSRCTDASVQTVSGANPALNFVLPQRTDDYGYVCDDTLSAPVVSATSIVTDFRPTDLYSSLDEGVADIVLPFAFNFYGITYTAGTSLTLSSNGNLRFEPADGPDFGGGPIPSVITPNNAIYALWTDVDMNQVGSRVYTSVVGTTPNRQLLVEFRNAPLHSADGSISFVLTLEEGSNRIRVDYGNLDLDTLAGSYGLENQAGSDALAYAYLLGANNSIVSGRSVIYSRAATGGLRGRVTSSSGGPLAGAGVVLIGPGAGSTTTDSSGYYTFTSVLAGSYSVQAYAVGYQQATAPAEIITGTVVTLNFSLQPEATPTPCAVTFTDVPTTNIFYGDIRFLACRGVINGFPNGNGTFRFEPNSPTTRGQFAKIAKLGFALPSYTPGSPTFSDVPTSNVFYPFIEAAARAGAITGFTPQQCVSAGTPVPSQPCFRPNQNVTRAQVAIITQRARGYPALTPATPTFSDVPTANFAYAAIETLAGRGIINGAACASGGGLCFRPNDNIRRGELSKVVRRAIESVP